MIDNPNYQVFSKAILEVNVNHCFQCLTLCRMEQAHSAIRYVRNIK